VPRQSAHVSCSVTWSGVSGKPCGCDCPAQMRKIRSSDFRTLETIENFRKISSIGQLNIIKNSGVLKTGVGQDGWKV
jgi:hypothetical protein